MAKLFEDLEHKINYFFKNQEILRQALAHPSALKIKGENSFERLEFLGDRVLGLVMSHWLFQTYPKEPEGKLARRFGVLVGRQTLCHVAEALKLSQYLLFDHDGDKKRHEETILSDGCEALIGALFLDGGLVVAETFIRQFWDELIDAQALPPTDTKSALQEWAQAQGKPIPHYEILTATGPDHNPQFEIQVRVCGLPFFVGVGHSKREAEKKAAQNALNFLNRKES